MLNLGLLFFLLLGYFIGCFPTAWILNKVFRKIDIREHGTGNVGAMNTYEVSGSKMLGITTAVIDVLKGVLTVVVAKMLVNDWLAGVAFMSVGCLLGHNYNVFLKFKGGRGLATAAGIFLAASPLGVVVWLLMFATGYFVIMRNVHVGSMIGILGVGILFYSIPNKVITDLSIIPVYEASQMRLYVLACAFVLFLRHIQPIREIIATMNKDSSSEE